MSVYSKEYVFPVLFVMMHVVKCLRSELSLFRVKDQHENLMLLCTAVLYVIRLYNRNNY
jgi:hypothetical protein